MRRHPLLGEHPRWTRLGLGFLAFAIVIVALQRIATALLVGRRGHALVLLYDLVGWAATAIVALSVVVAIIYASGNGGPVIAMGIVLAPALAGSILRGHLGVTTDLAVVLGAATCAGWIGVWRSFRRSGPSRARGSGVGVAVAVTVVSVGTISAVAGATGVHGRIGLALATLLVGAGSLVATGWALRAILAHR